MCMVYITSMLRVNIYIPKEDDTEIGFIAKSTGKNKAEVTRIAIREGLNIIRPKAVSASKLLDFAKEAGKIPTVGTTPKDIIKNLDFYTWGGSKRD